MNKGKNIAQCNILFRNNKKMQICFGFLAKSWTVYMLFLWHMHELLSQYFGRRRNVVYSTYERYFAMKSASFHSEKARNAIFALSFFLHVRDLAVDCIHWFNAPSRFCRSMFRFVFENKTAAICNGALVLGSNYSFFSLSLNRCCLHQSCAMWFSFFIS